MADDTAPQPQWRSADLGQTVADAATRFQIDTLAGLTVEQARAIVEAAGGHFQPYQAGDVLTADLRTNRVRALVEDGHVQRARVG